MARTKHAAGRRGRRRRTGAQALDLENYVPYYINMISNKLTRGSSRLYARLFGVGVIEWRVLGFLKIKDGSSANEICQVLAMDKAAASRALGELERKGLVRSARVDGRQRALSLTRAGQALHDRIFPLALERERILLATLTRADRAALLALLRKLRANLARLNVETDEN